MDILIKNMEMPKGDIPLVLIINSDGSVDEIDGSDEINATDAKAIEIPPHGRLIDADVLIKRNRESKGLLEEFKGDPTLVNVGYKSVIWEIKDLENAPTVLEAGR